MSPAGSTDDFSEAEYQDSLWVLNLHIFEKTLQLGSVIGTVVGLPLFFFRRSQGASLFRTMGKSSLIGTAISAVVLNPVVYFGKTSRIDRVGIYDRGYRLKHNQNQNRTDRYSVVGAGAGAVLGFFAGGGVAGALQGASLGISAGVAAHVAQQQVEGVKN